MHCLTSKGNCEIYLQKASCYKGPSYFESYAEYMPVSESLYTSFN